MAQTSVNIRMDEDVKKEAENLFSELGMNMTTAFNIFVRQAIREHGIPFQIKTEKTNYKPLNQYLEEYHNKNIEAILNDAEKDETKQKEIDWGKPVGEEVW